MVSSEERQWGMFCHLAALGGIVIPFGNVVGPLIVWMVKKAEMPFVNEQGMEALNFQISMTIYLIVTGLLMFVLIGFLLFPVVAVADLVLLIIAGIKASNGESYHYPVTIRFLKA